MATKKERGIQPNIKLRKLNQNLIGISQNRDERFLQPYEAVDVLNMHSLKYGTWSADRAGFDHLNGTVIESGASIDGLHWFTDATGTDYLLAAANGKLKIVNAGTGVVTDADTSAGYTVGGMVDFQSFNNVVFSCDGDIATPRKWDGTTAANSGGFPISDGSNTYSQPKYITTHQNRLVYLNFQSGTGADTQYPSHLAISDQNDGETFTQPAVTAADSYIGQVNPGDGQDITGATSLPIPNSNEDILVVFKERGIFALVGSSGKSTDADAFKLIRINPDYGAFNNRCIVQVGSDIYALNEYGVVSYSSANQSGSIQPIGINADKVKDVIDSLNYNAKDKCWGIHLKDRKEVWFGLPTGASTQVNAFIVYKYPSPGVQDEQPRWSRRSGFTAGHGVLYKKTFFIGRYNGYIGEMFAASNYAGTGIPWRYEFPEWDIGNEQQFKRVLFGSAQFRVRSNQSVTLLSRWKGGGNNDTNTQTLDVSTTLTGSTYGTAVYGTGYYGDREEPKVTYNIPGNGERIKYTLSGSADDSGPEFLGLTNLVEYGGVSQHWN